MGAFRWHPAARLFGPDGEVFEPTLPAARAIADRPVAMALARALAHRSGFRIGSGDPVQAQPGMFETLTGGSTGVRRRIMRSVESWTTSFAVNASVFGIGPGMPVGVVGRLSHSLALYGAMEGMHLGADVHLFDGLRPDRAARALKDRRVSLIYAAPAHLRLMVEANVIWPDLRQLVVGGAKLDAGLRARLAIAAPAARVTEFYGAAETSFITMADDATPDGSVGRAFPGVEIDLRSGVIWVRSPYLFAGYAGSSGGATWDAGWLSVGEMGRLVSGYLFLSGRAGRMVTIADQNVFPEEIEFVSCEPSGRTQCGGDPPTRSCTRPCDRGGHTR